MDFIFVEGLQVDARVGIYPREQLARQAVEINLTFGVPEAAAERDHIADTIDYDKVITRIREILAERHFNLLETLGEFIVKLMFDEFECASFSDEMAHTGANRLKINRPDEASCWIPPKYLAMSSGNSTATFIGSSFPTPAVQQALDLT